VAIFGTAIFSYQVNETERAVVLTFNKITGEKGPGLHFRWPLPIQKIVKYDIRLRCYDGNIGKLEEIRTADGKNITAGIYPTHHGSNNRNSESCPYPVLLPDFHRKGRAIRIVHLNDTIQRLNI